MGLDEIRTREHKLPPRLRTLLIMVDGATPVGELENASLQLGAPPQAIEALLARGLIAIRARGARADGHPSAAAVGTDDGQRTEVLARHSRPAEAGLSASAALDDRQRFDAAKKLMNNTVVDILGLRAFFFTLKLEKCFGLQDLRGLVPDFEKALTKGGDQETTVQLMARVRAYLKAAD